MNFLAPLAAILGALSIPIILLYMLRLRRTEMAVSSNFLWRDLVRDREANAPWQRLRFSWLLLLQLLILAALVFALMRPFIEVETISAGQVVVLLDASASMNSTDVEGSRFEAAQQTALDLVGTMGGDDEMTIIRVADVPEVLVSTTDNRTALRNAIQDAEPGDAPADWTAALTLAAAGSQGAQELDLVIISDGGLPGGLPNVPGDIRLAVIGNSSENLAISALATRSVPGEGPQLFAQITNYGTQDAETIFDIHLGDELFDAQSYQVPAGDKIDVIVEDLPDDFSTLTASLSAPASSAVPDYLSTDNRAYSTYNTQGAGRVLLVTERNIFLSQIFGSLPGVELTLASPEQGLPVGEFDLYVLDGWLPPQLPEGDLFIINPPSNTPLFQITGQIDDINQAAVSNVVPNDPITQYLDFGNVNIRLFRILSGFEAWGRTLIQAQGGPLLVAGEIDNRQVAVLAFALQDSDLPLQLAWPILVSNLATWYTPPRILERVGDTVEPGSTVVIRPPAGDRIRITLPDEDEEILQITDSPELVFAGTTQTGIYDVEVLDGDEVIASEPFAVNMFSSTESDIEPIETVTIGTTTISEAAREEKGQRELWQYLALLGLAALLLEWLYYHRAKLRSWLARWRGESTRPTFGGLR